MTLGGIGHGGRGRRGGSAPLSEINIIPLVDVVLVLLIIFMLTAHVMEFGLEVEVPKVKQTQSQAKELPVVTVSKEGNLQLNETAVNINQLGAAVRQKFPSADSVYLRGDKSVTYETLAQVISALGDAKLKVNLVTKPEDDAGPRR